MCREPATVNDDDKGKKKLENVYKPWAPGGYVAFRLLLAVRMCAALWSNISDCDETYNYWEPVRIKTFFTPPDVIALSSLTLI